MGKLLTNLPQLTLAQLWPTLRSTTVGTCRRDLKLSHRPDGKIADVLATTHACTTAANTPANYRMYVPQRPSMFPIAPMGKLLTRARPDSRLHKCERSGQLQWVRATETLEISHPTHGRLIFCSLFAGRWCLCLWWHSDHLIVHHQWERSICARSSSKVPIARWEHC
jgi:hypothetical protein